MYQSLNSLFCMARLHHSNQYLVSIHCAAHRLALACSQAGEDDDYVSKFKRSLSTLFWFFQASPVRTSGMKAIHEMLNSTYLKLKEAKDVRWLSHDQAVQTLRRCLAAVLTALEREAVENGEAVAVGLVKVMKSYHFIACLHLMSEVLPHLSHLSRLFQGTYIQLSMIQPHLNACTKTLTSYRDAKTFFFSKGEPCLYVLRNIRHMTADLRSEKLNLQRSQNNV